MYPILVTQQYKGKMYGGRKVYGWSSVFRGSK